MNDEEKEAIEKLDYELTYSYIHNQGISKETLELFKDIIEKQQKQIQELKHFKKEVTEIIKYADDTAEPTYWNIRKLLGLGE